MTSFQGKLVLPNCRDRFKAFVEIFTFDNEKGNIILSNEIILPSKLEITGVDIKLESLTGKTIPMLLLKSNRRNRKKDEHIYYIFALDFCCRNVLALRKLAINYSLPQYSANPKSERTFLIDGPGIIWTSLSRDHLCIAIPSASHQCELTVFPINCNEIIKLPNEGQEQVINSVNILSVCLINNVYIIIGVLTTDGGVRDSVGRRTEKQSEQFFAMEFGKESGSLESWRCKQLNPSLFLPPDYASVVTCLNVFKNKRKSSANNISTWQVYAGTSEGYVFEIIGGHLTRCISLPSSDIFLEASPIDCLRFLIDCNQEILHVMVAQGQTISAIRTSDFKVHEQWSNIHHVFVDDFLQKHLPQVLLIQGTNLTESSWILTDLSSHLLHSQHGSTHSEPSRKPDSEVPEPDQNTMAAVNALESRLQRERFAIQEKEKQLDTRHQLIVESFSNLQHQLEGQSLLERRPQVELFPLVQSSKPDTAPPPEIKQIDWVQVKCIWQRLVHDKWVIGVEFVNQSNMDLSKLSLLCVPMPSRGEKRTSLSYSSSLKLDDAIKTTSIHAVLHSSGPYHLSVKRPRTEFEDLLDKIGSENESTSSINSASKLIQTFICTCNLPDFSSGPVAQLSLIWHYYQGNIEQSQEHVKTGTEKQSRNCQDNNIWNRFRSSSCGQEKSKMFTKVCGNIELNSRDVINKSWNVDIRSKKTMASIDDALDLSRDRIALDAAQQRIQVFFKFPAGIFYDLDKLLSSQCGLSFSNEFGCYICSSLTDLQNVRIQLSVNRNQGETTFAEIYTCSDSELYLLVHHLYSCLPDCCLILPANSNRVSQDIRLCLPPLTREVYFLSSKVRTVLKEPEEQINPVYMETDSESDVKSNRKIDVAKEAAKYKEMRESFHKVSEAVVDKRKLDELQNIWAKFREQTDKTVAKYCQ